MSVHMHECMHVSIFLSIEITHTQIYKYIHDATHAVEALSRYWDRLVRSLLRSSIRCIAAVCV